MIKLIGEIMNYYELRTDLQNIISSLRSLSTSISDVKSNQKTNATFLRDINRDLDVLLDKIVSMLNSLQNSISKLETISQKQLNFSQNNDEFLKSIKNTTNYSFTIKTIEILSNILKDLQAKKISTSLAELERSAIITEYQDAFDGYMPKSIKILNKAIMQQIDSLK